jgi:hypothetical protein
VNTIQASGHFSEAEHSFAGSTGRWGASGDHPPDVSGVIFSGLGALLIRPDAGVRVSGARAVFSTGASGDHLTVGANSSDH